MTEPVEPTTTEAPAPDGPVLWPNQDPVVDGVELVPQDPDLFEFEDDDEVGD